MYVCITFGEGSHMTTNTLERVSPPVRLLRLGRILLDLRTQCALTGEQVCKKTGWSTATLSRLERGVATSLLPGDIHGLLDLYAADQQTRQRCIQLVVSARTVPYWAEHKQALGELVEYVSFETEAELIRYWMPLIIPGLLQTRAYAQAVLGAVHFDATPAVVDVRARARIARQGILTCEDPVRLEAVIAEEALRRPVGGALVMREQLRHLLSFVALPNVEVRVLPSTLAVHPGMEGSFLLLTVPDIGERLYLETGSSGILDDGPRVGQFRRRFRRLEELALEPLASAALIGRIWEEMA